LTSDHPDDSSSALEAAQKLDDQTLGLLKNLQLRGASGLALELISPQLDGISDPNARLKFASILFDMMHIRGRYADAADLIRQELALYPPNAEVHSPLLLSLKIRFIHHQMFYRPVIELWPQMVDLLTSCDGMQNPESYGEILFMLVATWGRFAGTIQKHGSSSCVQYATPASVEIIIFWPVVCASTETFFEIEVTSSSPETHC
jgi:hypothetical protein